MIIPTEAKVSPVQTLVKSVADVALYVAPSVVLPNDAPMFAETFCRFAAMINEIKTTITSAVIAMMSAILTRLTYPEFSSS